MAKLPTEDDLGRLAPVQVPGGMPQASLPSGGLSSYAAVGQGVAKIGEALAKIGAQHSEATDQLELARAKAEFELAAQRVWDTPDDSKPEAFIDASNYAAGFIRNNPQLRERFVALVAPTVQKNMRQLWGNQVLSNDERRIEAIAKELEQDPSAFDARVLEIEQMYRHQEDQGLITRVEGLKRRRDTIGHLVGRRLVTEASDNPAEFNNEFRDWRTSRLPASAVTTGATGAQKTLLDSISGAEGTVRRGYEEVLGAGKYGLPPRPITSMTLAEAFAFGRTIKARHGESSAIGRYQIVGNTMRDAAAGLGLDWNTTKFDAQTQDRMALWIAANQGLKAWEGFKIHPGLRASAEQALNQGALQQKYAAVPPNTMTDATAAPVVNPDLETGVLGDVPGSVPVGGTLRAPGRLDNLFAIMSEYNPGALFKLAQDAQRAEDYYNDRLAKQEAQEEAAVAAQIKRRLIDAKAGLVPMFERAVIENAKLKPEKQNELLSFYDDVNADTVQATRDQVRWDQGGPVNRFDPEDKKYLDRMWTRLKTNLSTAQAGVTDPADDPTSHVTTTELLDYFYATTKAVPSGAVRDLRDSMTSGDPARVGAASNMVLNLLRHNPNVFAGHDARKELEDTAVKFLTYHERGLSPEEAAQRIILEQNPEYQEKLQARIKGENIDELVKKLVPADAVKMFDGWFSRAPNLGFNPELRQSLFRDFVAVFRDKYMQVGDVELAKNLARKQLERIWGVTYINGTPTVMRYAPELAGAYRGLPNVSERIAIDAQRTIKQETGQDVPSARIRIEPWPKGQTALAWANGSQVPYQLWWQDENGQWHTFSKPWGPDPRQMRKDISDEEAAAFAVAHERRLRASPVPPVTTPAETIVRDSDTRASRAQQDLLDALAPYFPGKDAREQRVKDVAAERKAIKDDLIRRRDEPRGRLPTALQDALDKALKAREERDARARARATERALRSR